MSYNLTKQLPSCAVENRLLLELESYGQRKIIELAPPLEGVSSALSQSFTITDKFGTETLMRVDDYQRSYFPDDVQRISIETKSTGKNVLGVEIKFGLIKSDSELSITFDGNSAREVAIGMDAEIFSIIESYKTANHLFYRFGGVPQILIMFALLHTILFIVHFPLFALEPVISVTMGAIFGAFFSWLSNIFSLKFRPYSTFVSRRNERRKKQLNWIVLGLLGFILFTVVGVYFRLKVFGF